MFTMTIRMSGAEDTVEIDGRTFDRSDMTKADKRKMARMVAQAFRQATEGTNG